MEHPFTRTIIGADDRRLRELILYIAERSTKDRYMGSTKLNKVLFKADFGAYLELGRPITGHPYFRLPNGPAPRYLRQVRDQMADEGVIQVLPEDVGAKKPLDRVVPARPADRSVFSAEELALVDKVLAELSNSTGQEASDESHLHVGWRLAGHRKTIPYETAFLGRVTDADIQRGRELARLHGWT